MDREYRLDILQTTSSRSSSNRTPTSRVLVEGADEPLYPSPGLLVVGRGPGQRPLEIQQGPLVVSMTLRKSSTPLSWQR